VLFQFSEDAAREDLERDLQSASAYWHAQARVARSANVKRLALKRAAKCEETIARMRGEVVKRERVLSG
jgi:hypothetical protein